MDNQSKLGQLSAALQGLWEDLKLTPSYNERVEPIEPQADWLHFTFTHNEEGQADQLIRAARRTLASFGPEYWLADSHSGAEKFRQSEHVHFKVRKTLIVSHLYWGVTFILCAPEEGYSLIEHTSS